MFDNGNNIRISGQAQVLSAEGDATFITTINNVSHLQKKSNFSLVPPAIQKKSPPWTPRNQLQRAQQRKSWTVDLLRNIGDDLDPELFCKIQNELECLRRQEGRAGIEDRGWIQYLFNPKYATKLRKYNASIKKLYLDTWASSVNICEDQLSAKADKIRENMAQQKANRRCSFSVDE